MKLWMLVINCLLFALVLRTRAADNSTEDKTGESWSSISHEKNLLFTILSGTKLPHFFDMVSVASKDILTRTTVCTLCIAVSKTVITQRKLGAPREFLADEIAQICSTLQIEDERVCRGVVEANIDIFIYIVDQNVLLSPVKVCGTIFQMFNCHLGFTHQDWNIDEFIPEGNQVGPKTISDKNTFKILHISDIHFDPLYTPGNNADCGEPMCCQVDQPDVKSEKDKCGYWTDYRSSDPPIYLVKEVLAQANTHDVDYVYYTGDIISHRVWDTSIENNTRDIKMIVDAFKSEFSVPVYFVLGNHEPHPLNIFAYEGVPNNLSTSWLFDLVAEEWSSWLPDHTVPTIKKGGYYTISPRPGFRIIAMNGNVCYSFNWWLIQDDIDLYDQLKWLAGVLEEAERDGESVHILNHVPSGDSTCHKVWSREFYKLLKRFSNTITGHFTGHTHFDEFQLYYDKDNSKAFGVNFNGASVTTFTNNNPSYKVFDVDVETFGLVDYEEWTFNLTEANLSEDKPNWYKLYSFREAYGTKNLNASEVAGLIERMARNSTLMDIYFQYRSRMADPSLEKGCDTGCKKDLLCTAVTGVFNERSKCHEVRQTYQLTSIAKTLGSISIF